MKKNDLRTSISWGNKASVFDSYTSIKINKTICCLPVYLWRAVYDWTIFFPKTVYPREFTVYQRRQLSVCGSNDEVMVAADHLSWFHLLKSSNRYAWIRVAFVSVYVPSKLKFIQWEHTLQHWIEMLLLNECM